MRQVAVFGRRSNLPTIGLSASPCRRTFMPVSTLRRIVTCIDQLVGGQLVGSVILI